VPDSEFTGLPQIICLEMLPSSATNGRIFACRLRFTHITDASRHRDEYKWVPVDPLAPQSSKQVLQHENGHDSLAALAVRRRPDKIRPPPSQSPLARVVGGDEVRRRGGSQPCLSGSSGNCNDENDDGQRIMVEG
jgi:hypothetical protein